MNYSNIFNQIKKPIGIVANDAGAANHIASWLDASMVNDLYGNFEGPADRIFNRECSWVNRGFYKDFLINCNTLISGTGWASSFEHEARRLAKEKNCYSIAIVDHWSNYRPRFIRENEEILPDEIWVTDKYAKILAEKEFSELTIKQMPNLYLEKQIKEVKNFKKVKSEIINILYVLEPIRETWGKDKIQGEFQALNYFMKNIDKVLSQKPVEIKLRPHPSDKVEKYDEWISEQNLKNISYDLTVNLSDSIAWSDIVVGCETYAMVVALSAGKKVISSLPSWAPPCILPHQEILKLSDLES